MALNEAMGVGDEPIVLRRPEDLTCRDCGVVIAPELRTERKWLHYWEFPAHACPQRAAREEQERAAAAAARREWERNPPEERIVEVRRRVRLPHWTPAGLRHLTIEPRWRRAAERLAEHRELWLKGQRPEKGLWLWGPTRRRKTAAVCGLAFDVAHRTSRRVLAWNAEDLLDNYRSMVGGRRHAYDAEAIEAADLLILDDLGTIKTTDRAFELLFGIVNGALDAWGQAGPTQTLYVTSNEQPGAMVHLFHTPEHPDGGERMVRRLMELCEVVEVLR